MKRSSDRLSNINERITLANIVSLISLAVIAGGIATSIYMNCVNRSLWLDEAMLAWSFSKRPFFQLWKGPLEWLQSAPLGWLYYEKTLSVVFGNTEFVLRIGSIIGYILTLFSLYYLLKQLSVSRVLCLLACAFYANLPFILTYSNVFKPYIFDGFVILLAMLFFRLYELGRVRFWILTLTWAVLIWFSTPVCFFEGGLLLAAGLPCLIKRDMRRLKWLISLGIVIVFSFAVNYFFWLGDKSIVSGMHDFWEGQNFPLIPTSLDDLKKMLRMTKELTRYFGTQKITVLAVSAVSLPVAVKRKETTVIGCYFGILISLFASWLNMFPIEDRMWCFIYPLIIFLVFYGISCHSVEDSKWGRLVFCLVIGSFFYPRFHFWGLLSVFLVSFAVFEFLPQERARDVQHIFALILALFLVFSVNGIRQYWKNPDAVFWSGEELNLEIAYLEENLNNDEHVYVYHYSVPGFQYKNGYDNDSIAGYKNNVTFGQNVFLSFKGTGDRITKPEGYCWVDYDCEEEIDKVISKDKVYIVSSHIHVHVERLEKLLVAMHDNGFLQLVTYEHQTPLWFFCRNIEDSKIHVSYETKNIEGNSSKKTVKVLLHNDGPAYINHQFEEVSLVNTSTGEKYSLPKNIAPGSSIDLTLSYEGELPPMFRLKNEYGLVCADSDYVPGN